MKDWFQECGEIARKIARRMLGTASGQDVEEIEDWKRDDERREHLYDELLRPESFLRCEAELEEFPYEEGWRRMRRHMPSSARRFLLPLRRQVWRRYAAVGLLCLSVGAAVVCYLRYSRGQADLSAAYTVPSKIHSACLTLGNGQIISLAANQPLVYYELNSMKLCQTPGGLSYLPTPQLKDTLIHNRISTLTGMEYELTLADSTQVCLNAESELAYPVMFQGKERVVEMKGEAYFRVAKNAQCPFVVHAGGLRLKVLGTAFNVRAYADEPFVQITLESGAVEVDGRQMKPGEQLCYDRQSREATVSEVDTRPYVIWHEGYFLFKNERLEDILRTLSRWYAFDYAFDDEAAKDVRIGACFQRYNSMEPILNMIVKTNLVKVSQEKRVLHFATCD